MYIYSSIGNIQITLNCATFIILLFGFHNYPIIWKYNDVVLPAVLIREIYEGFIYVWKGI